LGIGVTPSAWSTANNIKALQFGGGSIVTFTNDRLFIGQNFFFPASGSETYINTAAASLYRQFAGVHTWFNAPSGTAGTAFNFTQYMTLTAAGRLILGAGDSGELLQVNGTAKITGASSFGGNMTLSLNQNLATQLTISNTTSGSGATARIDLISNTSGVIGKRSSTTTNYKILTEDNLFIYNNTSAGDIAILNDFASGSIKLAAGGSSVAQWTIGSNGDLTANDGENIIVGTTTGTKIGTATSQKLSLWNATPIVQPTTGIAEAAFVENLGGSIVNVDSTFDGYTMQQVVKALRNMGALA
jgi:hypothetical protein